MGPFKFIWNTGKKLFCPDAPKEDAIAKITAAIEAANLGIKGLQVTYQDGAYSLAGECSSAAVRQRAVLLAGTVETVTGVDIGKLEVRPPEEEEAVEYYIIKSGDSLLRIGSSRSIPLAARRA